MRARLLLTLVWLGALVTPAPLPAFVDFSPTLGKVYCAGRALDLQGVLTVLRETLGSSDPWARRQGARFLATIGPHAKDTASALRALLQDNDQGVRDAVAEALKS